MRLKQNPTSTKSHDSTTSLGAIDSWRLKTGGCGGCVATKGWKEENRSTRCTATTIQVLVMVPNHHAGLRCSEEFPGSMLLLFRCAVIIRPLTRQHGLVEAPVRGKPNRLSRGLASWMVQTTARHRLAPENLPTMPVDQGHPDRRLERSFAGRKIVTEDAI
ncbi:uncharacterized protein BKA78DRAFT_173280 [Phyllosticta capitalensis]|uniref:uncharacterized protein n=1 Tax=Phyllosticta capitalensis TaxID=121624 RepID=UPI003131A085